METVHFETLGCRLNQIETESIARAFSEAGYRIHLSHETAVEGQRLEAIPSLCVVNTCTVTGKAEQKARRLIRSLLARWPDAPVLVTGCYAEVEAGTLAALDQRVCVVPGSLKDSLANLPAWAANFQLQHPEAPWTEVLRSFTGTELAVNSDTSFKLSTDSFFFHSRASIKIQDGCNNHCTYCRIRLARGNAVSLEGGEVIRHIREIAESGWKEVVLTGVNLSQYRSGGGDFADLLHRILRETNGIAIRISSLYPERIDEAILPSLRDPRIRPHFHLSVQSGSDSILRKMKRPYTVDTVRKAVEWLRSARNDPFIACDIITGFPGETDADFKLTLDMCTELNFAWIHPFPFSPRPGTEAWSMKPKIPERIAHERVGILAQLARKSKQDYEDRWIGHNLAAIVEKGSKTDKRIVLTENYLSLVLDGGTQQGGSEIRIIPTGNGRAILAESRQV